MKKAKIILAATALVALIGGALAFKAQRSQFTYWTRTTSVLIDDVTYSSAVAFCTSVGFNTSPTLPITQVHTTATTTNTKTTLTLQNSTGGTITLPFVTCGVVVPLRATFE